MKNIFKVIIIILFIISTTLIAMKIIRKNKPKDEIPVIPFSFSAHGSCIVFNSSGEGLSDLYTLDTRDKSVKRLTKTANLELNPCFSKDGKVIVFSASDNKGGSSHIYLMGRDGRSCRALTTSHDAWDNYPSFSNDGKHVIFSRYSRLRPYAFGGKIWDHCDVWEVNIKGTHLKKITSMNYRSVTDVSFQNDNLIIYEAGTPNRNDSDTYIYTIPFENNTAGWPTRIASPPGSHSPRPSFDGRSVVFTSDEGRDVDDEVWIMGIDGSSPKRLTPLGTQATKPAFSNDGKYVYFLSGVDRGDLYINTGQSFQMRRVSTKLAGMDIVSGNDVFIKPIKYIRYFNH